MSPAGNVSNADPSGVVPVSGTMTVGVTGSLVVIVKWHDFGPALIGVKLIPTSSPESGLIVAGNSPGFTSVKSRHEMIADTTLRLQVPTLLIFSVCAGTFPPQTARYLRVTLNAAATSTTHWWAIAEFNVLN